MKSDVISVKSDGSGFEQALAQAEAVAAFRSLPKKTALHLRLLTEEMMAMLREITGETAAEFWIEDKDNTFALHLTASTIISRSKREELLSVSSTGKNAAAKGVLGKLRDIFECAMDADSMGDLPVYYSHGVIMSTVMAGEDPMTYAFNADMAMWSMQHFRDVMGEEKDSNPEAEEAWDELEKSVVANRADEVSIGIRGNNVEMIIYKKY